jgi:hypothetical protein
VNEVRWGQSEVRGNLVLRPHGDLDATTYRGVRDTLVKYAMAQPRAIIVVLDGLHIGTAANLTVFSSAWMLVGDWPGVPIILVAPRSVHRAILTDSPMRRFVPVCHDLDTALATAGEPPRRRRTEVDLVPDPASSRHARTFVRDTCRRWHVTDQTTVAEEIATELVENSITHAGTDLRLRLELRQGLLTVAVSDHSAREAVIHEPDVGQPPTGGLRLVAHLARVWGCAPELSGGKVVWAVVATADRQLFSGMGGSSAG